MEVFVSQFEKIIKTMSTSELIEFREFLHDHLNHENFTFWLEVEKYKQINDPKERKTEAMRITTKFFTPGPYELNIPYPLKDKVKDRLLDPDTNCFFETQKAIAKILYEDVYPKFISSPGYKKLKEPKGKKEKKQPRQTESYSTFEQFLEARKSTSVDIIPVSGEPKKLKKESSFFSNLTRRLASDDNMARNSRVKRSSSTVDMNDITMAKSL